MNGQASEENGEEPPSTATLASSNGHQPEPAESQPGSVLRDSNGWDGKLRVDRNVATVQNPEALSSDYSDSENVLPGEEIDADEDLLDGENLDTDDINLTQSRIVSIPNLHLERFKNTKVLRLRQNQVVEIEGLSDLAPTLNELDLYDNLISHIRGLDKLTALKILDLSYNKIRHIKNIGNLTNLVDLYLVSNKIKDIEGLDTLVNLRQLELGANKIREIQNLDALKNLEELYLGKNKIEEIRGLGGLPKLKILGIQANRISDLSPLREVPQLEELYASNNALESLEGLESNINLTMIEITTNKVKSFKGLGGLTKLTEIWAGSNQISDFADIERELADKQALATIYLENNPCQLRQPALYRNKVRLALPRIQKIDASFVQGT